MTDELTGSVDAGRKVASEDNEVQTTLHLGVGQRENWGVGFDASDLGIGGGETGLEHGLPLTFRDLISMVGTGILLCSPLLLVQSFVGIVDSFRALGQVEEVVLVPGHAQHLSTQGEVGDRGIADHGGGLICRMEMSRQMNGRSAMQTTDIQGFRPPAKNHDVTISGRI